uniref:Uncharacterized protein n=1 Tax=Rhizophora mucronata TaxID=61149 RepID=A0A2P2P3X4_RHIMU
MKKSSWGMQLFPPCYRKRNGRLRKYIIPVHKTKVSRRDSPLILEDREVLGR